MQDLWLLLPDRAHACYRELELILEGYEQFRPFDRADLRLIEPLRLMRILYYLPWSARQREDRGFMEAFPGRGSEAFWIKEIEDVRTQLDIIHDDLAAYRETSDRYVLAMIYGSHFEKANSARGSRIA